MKRTLTSLLLIYALVTFGGAAAAALLGVGSQLGSPNTQFPFGGMTSYNAANGQLTINATPNATLSSSGQTIINGGILNINVILNPATGAVASGVSGNDLEVRDNNGTLLTGEIVEFGSLNLSATTDLIDFRFRVTGGSLAAQYGDNDIGVDITMEGSDFDGSFTRNFGGGAKGNLAPIPSRGTPVCPPSSSGSNGTTQLGTLFVRQDPATGNVFVRIDQSLQNANDNTYGANAIGWGSKGHTFKDLTGSDRAEFIFKDANGNVVLDFALDYISLTGGTPSGYKTLGPDGGDGFFKSGNRNHILSFDTSHDRNLNDKGYCANGSCTSNGVNLFVNSPPATENYEAIDAAFDAYEFVNSYEVLVSKDAFGSAGFGSVTIGDLHNSPSKKGIKGEDLQPCPAPTDNNNCSTCSGGVTQLRLAYKGASAATIEVFAGENSTRADQRLFSGAVDPNGTFSFTGAGRDGVIGTNITITVNGVINTTIHTSCSKPIGPGLKSGSFEVVSGTSKSGGQLCPVSSSPGTTSKPTSPKPPKKR